MSINCNIDLEHYVQKKNYPGYITQEDINHLKYEWTYGVIVKDSIKRYLSSVDNDQDNKVTTSFMIKDEIIKNVIAKFTKTDVKYKMLELRV